MSVPVNFTPYAVAQVFDRDADGGWAAFVTVKASYRWSPDGRISAAAPAPIQTNDVQAETPGAELVFAREIGPRKRQVDVIVAGALTFAAATSWADVALTVGSRIRKALRVFGDRMWLPRLAGPAPSAPKPLGRLPVTWTRSFGGSHPTDATLTERRNPAGCGLAGRPEALDGQALPSFELIEAPIASWRCRPSPCGFGPVAAHWLPRVGLAGTYDMAWRRDRFPLLPLDFNPLFYNVAPGDQQLDVFRAGETVQLTNMTPDRRDTFDLPGFRVPVAFASIDDLVEDEALVDTIIVEPELRRLSLVAKAEVPLPDGPSSLRRVVVGETTRGVRLALERGKNHRAFFPSPRKEPEHG